MHIFLLHIVMILKIAAKCQKVRQNCKLKFSCKYVEMGKIASLFIILNKSEMIQTKKKYLSFSTPKGNQIWLSGLPLAWQQFQKQSPFQPSIPQNNDNVKEMIQYMSSLKCTTADMDTSMYYRAGANSEAANEINKDLETFFYNKVASKVTNKNHQLVFYCGMNKDITLKHPFYFIPGKIMHFCRSKVPCFEPYTPQQRKQVFVLNYTNQDNFAVRIDLADKDSQMFVLMSKFKVDLEQIFQLVRKSDEEAEPMTNKDVFKIPQLNLQAHNVITDLNNVKVKFVKQSLRPYQIGQLVQDVYLKIIGREEDDNIDALTLTVPQTENPKFKSRRMCLKDPFWLVLKYKGCNPYFAMYVNKQLDNPNIN